MMYGSLSGMPWGMGGFGWLGIITTIVIVGLIAWLVMWLIGKSNSLAPSYQLHSSLNVAKERYAKGEISRKEFEQLKRDLS
ncbi:SHOCT domain-containing protein [Chloroflexota bacterium]